MTTVQAVSLSVFILVPVLFWVWVFAWRELFVDEYRQKLFSVRDELFHAAHKGEISFESDEYQGLRESINRMIRFAHDLTPFMLVCIVFLSKKRSSRQLTDARVSLAQETHPDAHKLVMRGSAEATVSFLISSSVLFRLAAYVLFLVLGTRGVLIQKIEPILDEMSIAGGMLDPC